MHVTRLEVVDFRNHPAAALDLPTGVSVLAGPNGVGKTNLLEALGYLATLSSHRLGQEAALVRVGAEAAVVRAVAVTGGRRVLVEVEIRPGRGVRGQVNRARVPRVRDLLGVVRAVTFAPEDVALVRGDPEERRRFLDTLAVQRRPGYLATRQDYERVLKQRNTLLRSAAGRRLGPAELATLDVWDEKLASAGGEVWAARLRLVRDIAPLVQAAYGEVAGSDGPVQLEYLAAAAPAPGDGPTTAAAPPDPAALAALLRARLTADRPRELERGVTLSGPHRDDLALVLDGLPARTHASQGEVWSLALALRLGAHRLLASEGEEPVLLLDDVFAELDPRRRARLAAEALAVEQAVVTAAVPEELPAALRATVFQVRPGRVERLPDRAPGGKGPGEARL